MFNTKTYDSTNNNYNANFDTYIIGNNNVPVDGVKYYSNKFGQVMTSFIVDSGDSILGGNLIVTESTIIHGKSNFKNDVTITGKYTWSINYSFFKFVERRNRISRNSRNSRIDWIDWIDWIDQLDRQD